MPFGLIKDFKGTLFFQVAGETCTKNHIIKMNKTWQFLAKGTRIKYGIKI